MRDVVTSHQLTRPIGQPEDIAELVAFLASERAKFITGTTISIDAGLSAHGLMYADTIRMFEGS